MKIKVNKEKCLGCATCCFLAPNTFEMAEDGKSRVKNPQGDSEEKILQAVQSCPSAAIEIEGEKNN